MNCPVGLGAVAYQGVSGALRVLVVDDEEIIRLLLRESLERFFSFALVDSCEAAVPFLVHAPPDVLIVDKNLPGRSGLTLLEQVKAFNLDTEVIVITGYASLESAIEALRLGAYDYLIKPFDEIGIVVEKVRRAGEKKQLRAERRAMMEHVIRINKDLTAARERERQVYLQTLASMIAALEARDAYTRGHSDRVAQYSALIAQELSISGEAYRNLVDGARLHDLGKIGIREEVLNKVGSLTDEEYQHVQTHPDIGAEIVGKLEIYQHLVPMVRHHHERYDGKGYPQGLQGDNIPIEARIIAVADTFDAMTSQRSYRKPRTFGEAAKVVREVAGTQLDPKVAGAFLLIHAKLPVL